jgi:hypothetical protein
VIPVRITIHLVARLVRMPLLRVDGTIVLEDHVAGEGASRDVLEGRRDLPVGRLLALAESELAAAGHGPVSAGA